MKRVYKLVVVEDEAPIRRSICNKLEDFSKNFVVSGVFKNGKQALESITSNPPDALFTDIRMPVMDGLELARSVRDIYPDLQIVVISGYSDFEYAREAIKYKVTDYLTKPLDRDELARVLDHIKRTLDEENPGFSRKAEELVNHSAGKALTREVIHYLKEHFTENLSIADVADHFNIGTDQLSRTFRKEEDLSPQQYLINLKINKACKTLILYPEVDIKSVGELVGYPDPYYFSRIFKKYTKMSPKEYRRKNLSERTS